MAKYVIGLSLAGFSLKVHTHVSYVTRKVVENNINTKVWTLSTYRLLKIHNWIFLILRFQDFGFDNKHFWEVFSHGFFGLGKFK